MILILVLWILAGLTLFMYSFLFNARVDHQVSAGSADRYRAQAIANSAIEYTIAALFEDPPASSGPLAVWFDNPGRFQNVEFKNPSAGNTPPAAGTPLTVTSPSSPATSIPTAPSSGTAPKTRPRRST